MDQRGRPGQRRALQDRQVREDQVPRHCSQVYIFSEQISLNTWYTSGPV